MSPEPTDELYHLNNFQVMQLVVMVNFARDIDCGKVRVERSPGLAVYTSLPGPVNVRVVARMRPVATVIGHPSINSLTALLLEIFIDEKRTAFDRAPRPVEEFLLGIIAIDMSKQEGLGNLQNVIPMKPPAWPMKGAANASQN